jgi:ankyrin repeat protein
LIAVDDGLLKYVKLLLAHGANPLAPDANGRLALEIAAVHGYNDIVDLLASHTPELVVRTGVRYLGSPCV